VNNRVAIFIERPAQVSNGGVVRIHLGKLVKPASPVRDQPARE
jgi:hypothetical protein